MLHILGVSHFAQSRKASAEETEAQREFSRILKHIIRDVHPAFVAEEESEENLRNQEKMSIAKDISDSTGVEHRFCDPNQQQRRSIGYLASEAIMICHKSLLGRNLPFEEYRLKAHVIEMAQHFPKRERFWLQGLTGCREQDAVFICGESHIESFTNLLHNEDIPYRVVERAIGMTEAEREDASKIVQYLESHPELRSQSEPSL
jgi:hypothetical protein